ncbi:hypothetical protein FDECE_9556 [Fusarium decemcellulare]|nr:hypothetical protein FDECE_9556 [Fusarium decemcellulare]
MSRTPFGGFMGGGSRQPQGGAPPPQAPYGGGQQPQGYGAQYRDPRQQQPPRGYQGDNAGYANQAPYGEKPRGPSSQSRAVPLRVEKLADKSLQSRLIYGNLCAVAPEDFPPNRDGSDLYILLRGGQPVGEYVVTAKPVPGFPQGGISLSDPQRSWAGITMRDQFTGQIYDPFASGPKAYLGSLDLEIGFASPNKKTDAPYDEEELCKMFIHTFQNQVLSPGQRILMDVRNIPLLVIVKTVGLTDLAMTSDEVEQVQREPHARGILTTQTRVLFHRDGRGDFNLKPSMTKPNANAILKAGFKFEDMGIGGLSDEFATIFRRAFASRVFPAAIVAKMGIEHVRGMLLYGPPGTGKTLMARKIGKMLNAREPKVINGPEVLNKYVGQSEENIRKMFADAEKEYKEKGDESGLHIIIFDELDAVCKQRGSGAGGGTGVGDSVVNQLLSKLDGVDQLNNILLIGMTNRKDMIDDALLRPGRLEVHVEISLPDEKGRLEIINIHTAKMRDNDILDHDVDLDELAKLMRNYSGAEIKGVVNAASARAFSRHTEVGNLANVKQDVTSMRVKHEDFLFALTEVKAAFGVSEEAIEQSISRGIIRYTPQVDATIQKIMGVASMIKEDPNMFSTSVLFHGPRGSGKTALAAHIAQVSGFPFMKMISPGDLVTYGDDFAKKQYVHRVFTDAYKSPTALLLIDDFERLIGWNPIGPRFSNVLLEALTTLIITKPPKGHRLLILVTTSNMAVLQQLGIRRDFANTVYVPAVSNLQELGTVLQDYQAFKDRGDVVATLNEIEQQVGRDSLNVGIKTVLDRVSEARARGRDSSVVEEFADLIVQDVQESRKWTD